MTKTFFVSDTHFGHYNICHEFKLSDGTPSRLNPETNQRFSSVEEMDEYMIKQWNSVVNPKDRVYHVGDFCINRRMLKTLHRLNGRIKMILGNHDLWKKSDWDEYQNVDHILGAAQLPKLGWIVTHIPVHERQLVGRWTHNIHGHLHNNTVGDKRYFNVSVEQINYTPIEIEQLKKRLK